MALDLGARCRSSGRNRPRKAVALADKRIADRQPASGRGKGSAAVFARMFPMRNCGVLAGIKVACSASGAVECFNVFGDMREDALRHVEPHVRGVEADAVDGYGAVRVVDD